MKNDSFYFRTSDIWHAAAFWALGYALSTTEVEDDRVVFVFADSGEAARKDADALLRGDALVKVPAIQQGYYTMRHAIRGVRDAQRA